MKSEMMTYLNQQHKPEREPLSVMAMVLMAVYCAGLVIGMTIY